MDPHGSQQDSEPEGSVDGEVADLQRELDAAASTQQQAERVRELYDKLERAVRALPPDRQAALVDMLESRRGDVPPQAE